ncbi:phosphopantetheine-binding protein [Parabacteroides sp. OttesenSCG-928-N08]|nr:phosphopantetheine-binding protein [Parabacteroides sp. OttesenSCG-928-N08]
MERAELVNRVNEVLADEFEIEVTDITPDGNIKETLELDSLSLVDMVALIESTFGVKIKSQEIGTIKTFDILYDFILQRMND